MPASIYIFLLLELAIVGFFDITQKKIYNVWPLINLLAFLFMTYFYPQYYIFEWEAFIYSLVFLAIGLILFALRIMGAGDTKFLFSLFLLIPLKLQEDYLLCLLIVTFVVGSSLLLTNLVENRKLILFFLKTGDFKPLREKIGKKFPFAPLIFLSWVWLGWKRYDLIFQA